jgi:hypothetical protein
MRDLLCRLMTMLFGERLPSGEGRSRSIHAEADRTVSEERARLARIRPIIDRLPKRDDWQRMYDERFGR